MNVLQSMIIAFSMYSKLPMPHIAWPVSYTHLTLPTNSLV